MKIGRVTRFFPPKVGGLEFHALELTRWHSAWGHKVHVFTGTDQPQPVPAPALVHVCKSTFLGTIPSTSAQALAFWVQAWPRIAAEHSKEPFDVLHAHGDLVDAMAVGLLGSYLGIPTVVTVHGGLSQSRSYSRFAGWAFSLPTGIVAVSVDIRDRLTGFGIPPARILVRSSGVDYFSFQKIDQERIRAIMAALPDSAPRPLVVSVGRLHPVKGFSVLLKASGILTAENVPHTVVIVGGGSEESSLKAQVKGLPNVIFLGERPKRDIVALLQVADVFVLPSVILAGQKEGTPTALMEAMAAGLPCIITKAIAVGELFQHSYHGIIVEPGDAGSLAEALRLLFDSPNERREMGGRARERVRDRDWQVVALDILELYHSMLGCV